MLHATRALPALADLTPLQRAYFGYLANYEGATRKLYEYHLGAWLGLDPLTVERTHVALYIRYRSEVVGNKAATLHTLFTPIKGLYAWASLEGLVDRDPTSHVRLPKVDHRKKLPLEREQLRAFKKAAKNLGGRHWALAELLAVVGLRISEACSINIGDFGDLERGHPVLHVVRKGGKRITLPLPVSVLLALQDAAGDRTSGPLLTTRDGRPLTRHAATGLVDTITRHAKIDRHINPHLLRASLITAALDDGMSIRDAQWLAGHSDPRTTSRHYDLGMTNHDRHPVHIMAARLTA